MVLVDGSQARFRLLHSGFQNVIDNAPLLVSEQRLERVDRTAKALIEHSKNRWNIGPREHLVQFLHRLVVGISLGAFPYAGTERVISHVQDSESESIAFLRNTRTNSRLA